ncbi:hypothetical protein [Amycolatopsis sp. NBC_00438]|uniref:hypothetical protein n=1 Tax=Amycolatopsis sp. NBC_00438 TaxID=2903558 RepID=UPI002E1BC844
MSVSLRYKVTAAVVAAATALTTFFTCSAGIAAAEDHFCTAGTNWDNSIQACR